MSPCPRCGSRGRHVAATIPFDGTADILVGHACPNCDHFWEKTALDRRAALNTALGAHGLRLEAP